MSWQKILAQGFTCASELLDFLELPQSHGSHLAQLQFPSRIPRCFAQRMHKGDAQDPLLLQVLAQEAELEIEPGYSLDPLDEHSANPLKGLVHKYHGRVLLTLTGICVTNCRYCFRRHFPYQNNNPGRAGLKAICEYIAKDETITEVILSGGDPLLASDLVLSELIQQIELISHVHTLRIHTRIPIVLPPRIDTGLLAILKTTGLKKVVVLHCNHAQELDLEVKQACEALRSIGCHLLNQTVLLKGINDASQVLADLSQALFNIGVMPYYLHVLDKVLGVGHFDVSFERARALYTHLQSLLPGYLLPRLVTEVAGKPAKTLLI